MTKLTDFAKSKVEKKLDKAKERVKNGTQADSLLIHGQKIKLRLVVGTNSEVAALNMLAAQQGITESDSGDIDYRAMAELTKSMKLVILEYVEQDSAKLMQEVLEEKHGIVDGEIIGEVLAHLLENVQGKKSSPEQ